MRKTKIITLGILAATAIACDDPPTTDANTDIRHCVNEEGVVVDEALCKPLEDGVSNNLGVDSGVTTDDAGVPIVVYPGNGGMIGRLFFYRWYYGGFSRPMPMGTRIINNGAGFGSFRPYVGHVYSTPSNFGKGGFGSVGRGFSGGGGHVGGIGG
jgi:hypothetical protein